VGVFGNSAIIDRLDDWEFLDGLWIRRPGAGQLMELSYGRPAARLDRLDKCPASPAQPSGVLRQNSSKALAKRAVTGPGAGSSR
jgi:hypothetical protein